MEGEWRQFTLGELCSLITDGKHGDCQDQAGSGFYFLSVKDVLDGRLVYENARQIKEQDFLETHRRTNLEPGDVLFTNTGTIGRMAIALDDPRTYQTTFQKSVAILKPRRNLIEPRFLFYLLHFDNMRLSDFAAGTTQKNLLLKDFRSFRVQIPSIPQQRAITYVLGTLDGKIELNRRMVETLEGIARTIFKSWFVDFDPVRAKAEGRHVELPKHITDLFPDSFVDSELGEIPKGWEVLPFTALIEIIGGGTPKTSVPKYWDGEIPWFSVVDAPNGPDVWVLDTAKKITREGVNNSSTRILPVGTTIITARGTVGRIALVGVPMAMNQSCYGLRGKKDGYGFFTYFLSRKLVASLQQHAHGSVFDTITRDTLNGISVVAPPSAELIKAYETCVGPIMERIRAGLFESCTLSSIRDALLPKLISGQIRINDAEKMIAMIKI